jgi:hypothetical protein
MVLGVAVLLVAGAIAGGLFVLGSPAEQRVRRLDTRRVTDLAQLRDAIDVHWTTHGRLPGAIEELRARQGPSLSTYDRDPVTGRPYEYRALTEETFELCGTFERASDDEGRVVMPSGVQGHWPHPAGRHCVTFKARELQN